MKADRTMKVSVLLTVCSSSSAGSTGMKCSLKADWSVFNMHWSVTWNISGSEAAQVFSIHHHHDVRSGPENPELDLKVLPHPQTVLRSTSGTSDQVFCKQVITVKPEAQVRLPVLSFRDSASSLYVRFIGWMEPVKTSSRIRSWQTSPTK